MSRRKAWVHRHCGGRVVVSGDSAGWCRRCGKWTVGDAWELVRVRRAGRDGPPAPPSSSVPSG